MCWNCLQENHLDLPTSSERVSNAIRYYSDERALLAYLEPTLDPGFSWTGFAGNARLPVIVSYNLVDAGDLPAVSGAHGESAYFAFNATQRANFRLALAEISRVSGVVFVESQSEAMINAYGSTGSIYGGWASLANSGAFYTGQGELVINDSTSFARGGQGFHSILHELGHALGLKHPFEGNNRLTGSLDNTSNTLMSYTYTGLRQTLASLDIAALQSLYGAAVNTSGWVMRFENGDFVASGSARAETMVAVGQDSRISGLDGADRLYGRQGHDTLYGGLGNDTLQGGYGADRLDGGAGHDALIGAASSEVVYSDARPSAADTLLGGDGNDRLTAGVRKGILQGGDGDDLLKGVGGNDWQGADGLYGGNGNDTLYGSHANDTLNGGAGNDLIQTGAARAASGSLGDDRIYGGTGANQLWGNVGRDSLLGGGGDDSLYGGDQTDTLRGGDGNDTLWGDADDDFLVGDGGHDSLVGGAGYDSLYGGIGADTLDAGQDGGLLWGGTGNDSLVSSYGAARLYGEDGNDRLVSGSDGADALYGGAGNDSLYGMTGDTLSGGDGIDRLYGSEGARLTGGAGADVFEFATRFDPIPTRVTDLQIGVDRIRVDIGAGIWGNVLDSVTFQSRNGGLDTLAIVSVQSSTNTAEILFQGITTAQLTQGMFLVY